MRDETAGTAEEGVVPIGMPRPPELVGRSAELGTIEERLVPGAAAAVTLTGVAGVGKTALAEAAALRSVRIPETRRWWADLTQLAADGPVLETVATAVLRSAGAGGGDGLDGPDTRRALLSELAAGPGLLVLDGCEHVADACVDLVAELLTACDGLAIIATSQRPLPVPGGTVLHIRPLPLPPSGPDPAPAQLHGCPSVDLFVRHARAADTTFSLTAAITGTVTRICRRLDGLPLALELAGAQLAAMPIEEVETRVAEAPLDLGGLPGPSGTGPPPRTLRQALDRSHDLLSPGESQLFRRLSVLRGGWSPQAAFAVCGLDPATSGLWDAHRGLEALSLIGPVAPGSARFRMLEPVRVYAADRLRRTDERDAVARRLVDHVVSLVDAELPSRSWSRPPDLEAIARLQLDDGNLLAAIDVAERRGDITVALRLATNLWTYWRVRGQIVEARTLLERLLSHPGDVDRQVVAAALVATASFAQTAGDYEMAERYAGRAVAACRDLGDTFGLATGVSLLANIASGRGDHARAIHLYTQARKVARTLREPYGEALVATNLGLALAAEGRTAEARRALEEALELLVSSGDRWFRAYVLSCLGRLVRVDGDLQRVHELAVESAELLVDHGGGPELAGSVEFLASLATEAGDVGLAIQWYAAAEAARSGSGSPLSPSGQALRDEELRQLRLLAGESTFERAWLEGSRSSLAGAVASARATSFHQPRANRISVAGTWPLTEREFEVALRVAAGRTNKEIGSDLHISAGTARTHVQHALRKLGFHSRSELAAWVARHRAEH